MTGYIFETLKHYSHNTPTMTVVTLLLADGAVKDAHFFLSFCLDVGRGHHAVQGTGGTV